MESNTEEEVIQWREELIRSLNSHGELVSTIGSINEKLRILGKKDLTGLLKNLVSSSNPSANSVQIPPEDHKKFKEVLERLVRLRPILNQYKGRLDNLKAIDVDFLIKEIEKRASDLQDEQEKLLIRQREIEEELNEIGYVTSETSSN